ncbi:hypothetical protein BJX66DRAFT_333021 [Aspergillus keveii]|uniref:Uncharacterized protein n=1 Tax=Aspergillus keveii TaxID=714993 RepID=A0ABR4GKE9_9EURO
MSTSENAFASGSDANRTSGTAAGCNNTSGRDGDDSGTGTAENMPTLNSAPEDTSTESSARANGTDPPGPQIIQINTGLLDSDFTEPDERPSTRRTIDPRSIYSLNPVVEDDLRHYCPSDIASGMAMNFNFGEHEHVRGWAIEHAISDLNMSVMHWFMTDDEYKTSLRLLS